MIQGAEDYISIRNGLAPVWAELNDSIAVFVSAVAKEKTVHLPLPQYLISVSRDMMRLTIKEKKLQAKTPLVCSRMPSCFRLSCCCYVLQTTPTILLCMEYKHQRAKQASFSGRRMDVEIKKQH